MAEDIKLIIIAILLALVAVLVFMILKGGNNKQEIYKSFVDTATLVVIIVGLYFAWDQAKKLTESLDANNRSLMVSTLASISQQTFDEDRIFIQYPDQIKYFMDGVDVRETDPDYPEARAISLTMLDYFDQVSSLVTFASRVVPYPLAEAEPWNKYFAYTLKNSPILCRLYLKLSDQYGATLREIAAPICQQTKHQ